MEFNRLPTLNTAQHPKIIILNLDNRPTDTDLFKIIILFSLVYDTEFAP